MDLVELFRSYKPVDVIEVKAGGFALINKKYETIVWSASYDLLYSILEACNAGE
jgi:hypothetical protein